MQVSLLIKSCHTEDISTVWGKVCCMTLIRCFSKKRLVWKFSLYHYFFFRMQEIICCQILSPKPSFVELSIKFKTLSNVNFTSFSSTMHQTYFYYFLISLIQYLNHNMEFSNLNFSKPVADWLMTLVNLNFRNFLKLLFPSFFFPAQWSKWCSFIARFLLLIFC